jgi:hypothetical protein
MKSYTEYLTLNIPARVAFQNITPLIEEIVRKRRQFVSDAAICYDIFGNGASDTGNDPPPDDQRVVMGELAAGRRPWRDCCPQLPLL